MKIVVVRTGVANLASVLAGLRRAGAEPEVSDDADVVREAPRAFLPGVGAFGAGMQALSRAGLDEALRHRVTHDRPLVAICLGLQLLARRSEETPGVPGLGLLDADVTRFRGDVRVPQLGWNRVEPLPDARYVTAGHAYFANSYKLDAIPAGWTGSMGDHGGPFVASVERGAVLACQFHPELSGDWGQALLSRWLEATC